MQEEKVVDVMKYRVDELEYFIEALRCSLTKVFARHSVSELTGNAIAGKTLANIMSDPNQDGPPSFKLNRTVCFERESFILWLRSSGRIKLND